MSIANRFGFTLIVMCVVAIGSASVMANTPPDPRMSSPGESSYGPIVSLPYDVDSVGFASSGYRSIHFASQLAGLTFPFQVTADNDFFYVGDYSGNTVYEYQIVAGSSSLIRSFGTSGSGAGQFSGPAQVAVVGNYIYVADYFNARIERFDKTTGAYVSQFGTSGSGAGQLSGPSGLVYNPVNGLLYVSETGNDRIQAFTTSGSYQFGFGTLGSGNGQLNNPFGLAVDSVGNIYAADTANNRVVKFDATGAWLRNIGVGVSSDYAVAVDKADNVWVTSSTGEVYVYDSQGIYESYYYGDYGNPTATAEGYLQGARGIAVTPPITAAPFFGAPAIIIAGGTSQTVQLFTHSVQPIAHPLPDSFGGVGTYSFGIAYDSAQNIYVTDYNNNKVHKFDKFGVPITTWGSAGSGNGQFSGIMGIAIDDSDNVYVADRNNNRIQVFTANGGYVTQWGSSGTGDGQFDHPAGVATDGTWLYVTEENNNRVQKFSFSGTYVRQWGTTGTANGQFRSPEGIAVDRQRNQVYVVEYTGNRIQQFTVFGDFIKVFSDSISGSGTLNGPLGLGIDQAGNVYCGDLGNDRVVQYNDNGTYLGTFSAVHANGVAVDPRDGQIRVGAVGFATVGHYGSVVGKYDTIGVYRPSTKTFYLRRSLTAGAPEITATVTGAASTDVPIVGDWNGDGIDTPGLWRPSTATFYLWDRWRGLDIASATYQFTFGAAGDKPIVGDWDANGRDGVGVFRPSNTTHYLKNKLIAGPADYTVSYGLAGDLPLGGDWNQDGDYSAGVYRPSTGGFYLTNRNTSGTAPTNAQFAIGANATDLPVTGDWTHNGSSGIGFFRAGMFYLLPNTGNADDTLFRDDFEPRSLTTVAFGLNGDIPLGGTWGSPPE